MRTVELLIVKDKSHSDIFGVIPSTYDLCRMYDDGSARFKIISSEDINLDDYEVYIRFIANNLDLGRVVVKPIIGPDYESEYVYRISKLYTQKSVLDVQIILVDSTGNESRTNVVRFKLYNSLPKDKPFYQNLSFLDRLVCDKNLVLELDYEDQVLILYDDLGNKLCELDVEPMVGIMDSPTGDGKELPYYYGDYVVVPKMVSQILNTENRSLFEDVIVTSIPYKEEENAAGGLTVTIGGVNV